MGDCDDAVGRWYVYEVMRYALLVFSCTYVCFCVYERALAFQGYQSIKSIQKPNKAPLHNDRHSMQTPTFHKY